MRRCAAENFSYVTDQAATCAKISKHWHFTRLQAGLVITTVLIDDAVGNQNTPLQCCHGTGPPAETDVSSEFAVVQGPSAFTLSPPSFRKKKPPLRLRTFSPLCRTASRDLQTWNCRCPNKLERTSLRWGWGLHVSVVFCCSCWRVSCCDS